MAVVKHNSTAAAVFGYATMPLGDVLATFQVSVERGLTSQQAEAQRRRYGPNQIASADRRWWQILWQQLRSPFLYLLITAAIVALLLGERIDAVLILSFILINTGLGFYQEYRSDRSLQLLKRYVAARDTIRRDRQLVEVDVADIVPGDIVLLKAGDVVPADLRLCQAEGLTIDESILTGESATAAKTAATLRKPPAGFFEAANLAFSGTTVVGGSAVGVAVGTGNGSAVGAIAMLARSTGKESDFARGIGRFSRFILRVVSLTIAFVFVANVGIKGGATNIGELLVFSIALAVAVIPEALPVVSTFSLTRGALHLAKKKVVVKRLSAIEDLGGIDVLCTDKTGTLTENVLAVVETKSVGPGDSLLLYANLAAKSDTDANLVEPFDKALRLVLKHNGHELKQWRRIREAPFDPSRRRNSVLVTNGKIQTLVVRGAPETVTACCTLKKGETDASQTWVAAQGKLGRRVLAVATKKLTTAPEALISAERNLTLLGFISFEDPIKKTTRSAVKSARELGVNIKVLTGDAPEVAGAVAYQIGLVADPTEVITGAAVMALPVQAQHETIQRMSVFARVSPEQKHAIVSILQESHSVGFLGEGINDAPALKVAGVSLVVQSAAGVAREAADIILLQKSLSVIVDGIREGREIFSNTLKYIRATLSSNFGNFYAVAIGSLFIDFLPMLPVQILLVNLLSDFPMIAIAADRVDAAEVRTPQIYRVRDIALIATLLGVVSTIFDFTFFALYFRISPAVLQTNWFIASIVTELVFLFSIRTRRFFLAANRPATILLALTALAFSLTLVLPYTGFGQTVFHFTPPTAFHLATILGLAALYFVATETVKLLYYRFLDGKNALMRG